MPMRYTLTCQNNSAISGTFCIFQVLENNDTSLALKPKSPVWMTKRVHTKTKTVFSWEENIFFVWGEYRSENIIYTSAKIKADINTNKKSVLFSYTDGAYQLQYEKQPLLQGKFLITTDDTVKIDEAVVGLGCFDKKSGIGTIVYDAHPNMAYPITPKFNYYVTFGNYKEGEIISLDNILTPYAKIPFSQNKTSFIAVMRQNNELIVRLNRDDNNQGEMKEDE